MAVIVTALERAEMPDGNDWLWIERPDGTLHLVVAEDRGPIALPDEVASRMAFDVQRCSGKRWCRLAFNLARRVARLLNR